MKNYEANVEQLELLMVKEEEKRVPAKWINFIPKIEKSCLNLVQTEKDLLIEVLFLYLRVTEYSVPVFRHRNPFDHSHHFLIVKDQHDAL